MKKLFRLETSCRIIEIGGAVGRPAMGSMSNIPGIEGQDLLRPFLISMHETKEAAQAALLGTAVGTAFGPIHQSANTSLFAISCLLQKDDVNGTSTTSHSLHWRTVVTMDEAVASAIQEALQLRPDLEVVDVLCADIATGISTRIVVDGVAVGSTY